MGMDDWVRVRLGRVGGELVATPLPRGAGVLTSLVRADGLLVVPAGLEGHHAGESVEVTLLRGVGAIDRTIVAVGSHDLVLDLAAAELRAVDPGVTLASSNVGSLGGLVALRDWLCHVAGSHLLDPASGEYTLPYVGRVLGGREVAVVRLVHRDQGLIVAAGNPLGIAGLWEYKPPAGEGLPLLSFSMLTVNADGHPLMQRFHKPDDEKRMVVILHPDQYDDWLHCAPEQSGAFLVRYPAELLVARPAPRQAASKPQPGLPGI